MPLLSEKPKSEVQYATIENLLDKLLKQQHQQHQSSGTGSSTVPAAAGASSDPSSSQHNSLALHDIEVYHLKLTNEVFTEYEEYVNKVILYKLQVWECAKTHRQKLTFEEALRSEKKEIAKELFKQYPKHIMKHICHIVHKNSQPIKDIVTYISTFFENNLVVGEEVLCELEPSRYIPVRIVKIVQRKSKAPAPATTAGRPQLPPTTPPIPSPNQSSSEAIPPISSFDRIQQRSSLEQILPPITHILPPMQEAPMPPSIPPPMPPSDSRITSHYHFSSPYLNNNNNQQHIPPTGGLHSGYTAPPPSLTSGYHQPQAPVNHTTLPPAQPSSAEGDTLYEVEVLDGPQKEDILVVYRHSLIRMSEPVSKVGLYQWIKENTYVESQVSGPLILSQQLQEYFHLDDSQEVNSFETKKTEYLRTRTLLPETQETIAAEPESLPSADLSAPSAEFEEELSNKKNFKVHPEEENIEKNPEDPRHTLNRPMPLANFADLPPNCISLGICCWNFLFTFRNSLGISAFPLSSFLGAIHSKQPSHLLVKVFKSLLLALLNERDPHLPADTNLQQVCKSIKKRYLDVTGTQNNKLRYRKNTNTLHIILKTHCLLALRVYLSEHSYFEDEPNKEENGEVTANGVAAPSTSATVAPSATEQQEVKREDKMEDIATSEVKAEIKCETPANAEALVPPQTSGATAAVETAVPAPTPAPSSQEAEVKTEVPATTVTQTSSETAAPVKDENGAMQIDTSANAPTTVAEVTVAAIPGTTAAPVESSSTFSVPATAPVIPKTLLQRWEANGFFSLEDEEKMHILYFLVDRCTCLQLVRESMDVMQETKRMISKKKQQETNEQAVKDKESIEDVRKKKEDTKRDIRKKKEEIANASGNGEVLMFTPEDNQFLHLQEAKLQEYTNQEKDLMRTIKEKKESRELHHELQLLRLTYRVLPLGTDRHYNRYWLFPGFTGMLLVESPYQEKEKPKKTHTEGMKADGESKPKMHEEDLQTTTWSYYDSVESIEKLKLYLDRRGARERNLLEKLLKWEPLIRHQINISKGNTQPTTEDDFIYRDEEQLEFLDHVFPPIPEEKMEESEEEKQSSDTEQPKKAEEAESTPAPEENKNEKKVKRSTRAKKKPAPNDEDDYNEAADSNDEQQEDDMQIKPLKKYATKQTKAKKKAPAKKASTRKSPRKKATKKVTEASEEDEEMKDVQKSSPKKRTPKKSKSAPAEQEQEPEEEGGPRRSSRLRGKKSVRTKFSDEEEDETPKKSTPSKRPRRDAKKKTDETEEKVASEPEEEPQAKKRKTSTKKKK